MSAHVPERKGEPKTERKRHKRGKAGKAGTAISVAKDGAVTVESKPTPPHQSVDARRLSRKVTRKQERRIAGAAKTTRMVDARTIAMSIACPAASYTPRVQTSFTGAKTATGNPWERVPTKNAAGTVTEFFTEQSTLFAAVFRNPLRAVVFSTNTMSGTATYNGYGSDNLDIESLVAPATTWVIAADNEETEYPLGLNYLRVSGTVMPHGPILPCGTADGTAEGDRFIWCDRLTVVTLNYSSAGAGTGTINVQSLVWTDTGIRTAESFDGDEGASKTMLIKTNTQPPGYYAWRIKVIAGGTTGNITVDSITHSTPATQQVMCHRPLPSWEQWFTSAQGIRINGASITLTNTTQLIERGGSAAAYQVPKGRNWWNMCAGVNDVIPSAQGSADIDVQNGMYTWLSPTDELDLKFMEEYDADHGQLYDTYYSLNPDREYIVMQVVDPSLDFQGFWTFNFGVEFLSDDVSREVREPEVPESVFREAMLLIKRMPKYAENPSHWATLLQSISKGAKDAVNWGMKNAPVIMQGADFLTKLAGLL